MASIKDEIEEYFESKMLPFNIEDDDVSIIRYIKAERHHHLDETKKMMMKLIDEVERQMIKWHQ